MIQSALHVKAKEFTKVNQLAGKVSTGITENPTIFVTPDPSMETLNSENTKLLNLIHAKDGSKQKNQAVLEQSQVVFDLLKDLSVYVDKVADGDKAIILLSGFDCNEDATPHNIPGKVIIRRITDGSIACSAKIYIETLPDADRYKVETSTTPNDASSWKTVLDPASSKNLEIEGLNKGQEIYIRVTGGNTHGWGTPSEYMSFIPR
ncbi:MAG TPA: fibronectin type III domain-containing protein [Prolixibacteraceae bacterium]|nr:fibronectin type III domain-containing protein [Prolixibacteraceae bacterium]HPS12057.1 fibronectin type III domain-containing protein [Prolixibacteraceae bacterium]